MSKRQIILACVAIICIALNIIWGNAISTLLTVTIVGSCFYYIYILLVERSIEKKQAHINTTDLSLLQGLAAFLHSRVSIASILLLTSVYIFGAIAIKKILRPTGGTPWYWNHDAHTIANSGITFQNTLALDVKQLTESEESKAPLLCAAQKNNASLSTINNFEPFFQIDASDSKKSKLLNPAFSTALGNHFTLSNGQNTFDITATESDGKTFYTLVLTSTHDSLLAEYNLPARYTDSITASINTIEKGISLYHLFVSNANAKCSKAATQPLLEALLREIDGTQILASYSATSKAYFIQPDATCAMQGYTLNGIAPRSNLSFSVPYDAWFYIGFLQQNDAMQFLKNSNGASLQFQFAQQYPLTSPNPCVQGGKHTRQLCNQFETLIQSPQKEIFFFDHPSIAVPHAINASISYTSQNPQCPLQAIVTDQQNNGKDKLVDSTFTLRTATPGIALQFQLRNLIEHNFSFAKVLFYFSALYVAMCLLLLLSRGKSLARIEPIVWAALLALLLVRMIMLWRIASFPPLNNISLFEWSGTIRNFDHQFMGIKLPLPFTVLMPLLAIIVIAIFRFAKNKNYRLNIPLGKVKQLLMPSNLFYTYCTTLFLCLVAHLALHVEILRRIVDVLLPICAYFYFSHNAAQQYVPASISIPKNSNPIFTALKKWIYYFTTQHAFGYSIATLAYFAIVDRGFGILFFIFLLFKNIIFNFLKNKYDASQQSIIKQLTQPQHYWAYAIAALSTYCLLTLSKSLFYYLLAYKFVALGIATLLALAYCYTYFWSNKKIRYSSIAIVSIYFLLVTIPFTRSAIDATFTNTIKHVQYRASIIHQPISELLASEQYNSFNTRKIIETAENQWFINTYSQMRYSNDAQLNLQPFSKVGVNYSTQTRDVVVARFIIAEMGHFTMYLLLVVLAMPLLIYLLSYQLSSRQAQVFSFHYSTYIGLLPLLLLFTAALFVWFTSTNRFVFFGQDFPILSLTSRLSLMLPLVLIAISLLQKPQAYHAGTGHIQIGIWRYALLFSIIIATGFSTFRANNISSKNFNIVVESTANAIEGPFDQVLQQVQDSLRKQNSNPSYGQVIAALKNDKRMQQILDDESSNPYTTSILSSLIEKPATALGTSNPLYIVYDNGSYHAQYNRHLYLELPPIEQRNVWHGKICEQSQSSNTVQLQYGNEAISVQPPYFRNDVAHHTQLAVLPAQWLGNGAQAIALLNVQNAPGQATKISICKNEDANTQVRGTSYTQSLRNEDAATVQQGASAFGIHLRSGGAVFADSKWVNGKYKIIYPAQKNNFWIYNFANAIKQSYKDESLLTQQVNITLNYNWHNATQQLINATYKNKNGKQVRFSVIAATANGEVQLLNDYANNRKILDPNNEGAIARLHRKHFFYSQTSSERDQWGNINLMQMRLGPGSSIKPLAAACIASQVNAGWEKINFVYPPAAAPQNNYAGLKLAKEWEWDPDCNKGPTMVDYIKHSSNYYHSMLMFLGSYTKSDFAKGNNQYSLSKILQSGTSAKNNFPKLSIDNIAYTLPSFSNNNCNWPHSDKLKSGKSFFANENSVLANGLELNAGLATKDKDKQDGSILSNARVNILDSSTAALLKKNSLASYMWSLPEESAFPQINRHYISSKKKNEIQENFNLGLKTATLGGYPYQVTPFKMLEMYNCLLLQNNAFALQIMPKQLNQTPWQIDSTWSADEYKNFLAAHIFKGMEQVVKGGTGTHLQGVAARHATYYFYAKTGTINESGSGAKSSRRLIVCIANRDLANASNISPATKMLSYYFTTDATHDFDWALINSIIELGFEQARIKTYFQ